MDEIKESDAPDDIINSMVVYFQMMDVAVKGGTKDLKAFTYALKAWDQRYFATDKERVEAQAKIYNDNLITFAFFVDSKKKFADVEYYAEETQIPDYNQESTLVYTGPVGWDGDYDYYYGSYNSELDEYVYEWLYNVLGG